jgi:hypothetical protein
MRSSQEDVCMHMCIFRYRIVTMGSYQSCTDTRFCEERGEECAGYPYPSHAAR